MYSFDFMGGNPSSRSGNNILAMSPFTEKDDLLAVLDMIRAQPFVDSNHVFLMGQSQGGVVSTMVAEERNDQIAGLILVYPAYVLFDDARQLFSSTDQVPEVYNHRGNNVGRVYFEKSLSYDPYADMPKVTKPVLIVHGTADSIAPESYSERAVSTFKNARLENSGIVLLSFVVPFCIAVFILIISDITIFVSLTGLGGVCFLSQSASVCVLSTYTACQSSYFIFAGTKTVLPLALRAALVPLVPVFLASGPRRLPEIVERQLGCKGGTFVPCTASEIGYTCPS